MSKNTLVRYRCQVPKPPTLPNPEGAEGAFLHSLGHALFPINRSITGDGVRKTLSILKNYLPGLVIHEVPSGTQVLDWRVPDEWNARSAFIEDPSGKRIVDFADSNIHLVSYSTPVETVLNLEDLQAYLHSDPEHTDAIPYVTSYYNRRWGFCLTEHQRQTLKPGHYKVSVDSTLEPGHLTYADLVLPGESANEILISTYVCHPSLANNELSGPLVALGLAMWLEALPHRRYTYRFVFAPETIGAVTYIAHHLEHLRSHVVAAINLTCIGNEGDYSYLASRLGNTAMDRIARRVIRTKQPAVEYTYLDRGSDERQYGMPGIDLPMISLMRTKYGAYPQYHTHLDDLDFVTPAGLQGGLDLVRDCISQLEGSTYFMSSVVAEPQLGKRGLYHTMHARTVADEVLLRTHILAYADGQHSATDMAELFDVSIEDLQPLISELAEHGLIRETLLDGNSACAPHPR